MNYEVIKETHSQYVVFKKIGIFYEVYGKDAYILNYLFNYQIKPSKDTVKTGVPVQGLTRITNVLDRKKINYLILETEVVFLRKFPNNKYQQYQKIDIIERKKRIMSITQQMSDCIDDPKIDTLLDRIGEMLCKINC